MPAYKDEERGTWYVKFRYKDWQGETRNALKRGFAKKKDALLYEENFKRDCAGASSVLFGDFLKTFYEDYQKRVKPTTFHNRKALIDKWLLPYFEKQQLRDITPLAIRKWQNIVLDSKTSFTVKQNDLSPAYIRSINIAMRFLFKFAEKYYNINNPARLSDPIGKEKNSHDMQFWTKEEFDKVIDSIVTIHYPAEVMLYVLFYSGLRQGELLALTEDDIDFDNHTISVSKTYVRLNGIDVVQEPKTVKSKRTIDMPPTIMVMLKEYLAKLPAHSPEHRIFPYQRDYIRGVIAKYAKKAEVKRIRVHDLRHSHASLLINMGYDILIVSQRLGHENVQTTWQIYSHLYPDKKRQVAEALDKLITP